MTIQQSKIQYVADGQNAVFETPFSVYIKTGVDIYFNSQKISADLYYVALDEKTRATISFVTPPPADTLVTINRVLPVIRTSQFQEGGALRANTLNYEFDYQMACLQDVSDIASRSMSYPPYAVGVGVDLTLPSPEAGKSIMWNADGTKLENSNVLVNELEEAIKEYKQEAEASAIIAQTAANTATQKADAVIVATDGKANSDMDNVSTTGKDNIINMIMPDYAAGINISSFPYTAPCYGLIYGCLGGSLNHVINVNGQKMQNIDGLSSSDNLSNTVCIAVCQDDVLTGSAVFTSWSVLNFYPYKGEI